MTKKDNSGNYEDWKDQDELTPEQEDQIYQDAINEIEGKKKKGDDEGQKPDTGGDTPDDNPDGQDGDDPKTNPDDEQEKDQDDDDKKKDNDDGQDEDSGDDDGDGDDQDPPELSEEEKKKQEAEEAEEAEKEKQARKERMDNLVIEYAQENNMSEEEAREVIEGEFAIADKYNNDIYKLARAHRSQQSGYSKLELQNKLLQERLEENFLNPQKVVLNGKEYTPDEAQKVLTEAYREAHPEKTEDLEDDEVWKLARSEVNAQQEKVRSQRIREIAEKASKKRVEIISDIVSSDNNKYLADIKPLLQEIPDTQLVSSAFDIKDILTYVKGKHYERDIKGAEERGYKRGLEEAKILGAKKPVGTEKPVLKKASTPLSEQDMQRAHEMFGEMGLTKEQIIQFYKDYLKQTKQDITN
ncbi:MAG: hypothetical protein GF364_15180 [Candidatus Lokiarchaeota archaeon]|nr:hypothetical protein [Candidatus Lokiarchaeota archaeon]